MFFATTKGKFAALFLVASRFASASAAPAQADIAIYELADDISIAPHASPAIDAHLMLTELDADDFAEWSDIIAAVSNAEAFALSEHEDTDNDALKEVSFDRMPRCEGCGKRHGTQSPGATAKRGKCHDEWTSEHRRQQEWVVITAGRIGSPCSNGSTVQAGRRDSRTARLSTAVMDYEGAMVTSEASSGVESWWPGQQ